MLEEASALFAEATCTPVDLVAYVRSGEKGSLATFAPNVAMIVAMEMAQRAPIAATSPGASGRAEEPGP